MVPFLALGGVAVLVALVLLGLRSCGDDVPASELGLCDNGIDDDEDGTVDCNDNDCFFNDPTCAPSRSGRVADRPRRTERDDPEPPDTPVDGGPEPDIAAEGDAAAGPDAGDGGTCDPRNEVCDWSCETDRDCVLVYDTLECCGGYPHHVGQDAEVVACVTATHRNRLRVDRCALRWSPGAPVPRVPVGCRPHCDGVSCPACPDTSEGMRAVCREGRCRALCRGCCTRDSDCPRGTSCVDPTNEGLRRCLAGEHECDDGEDCLSISLYSGCRGCNCGDVDRDGFRDCACYGCGEDGEGPPPGTCVHDRDCAAHEFCIDRVCVYSGEDSCREAMGDCGPCAFCQRNDDQDGLMRGTCVPIDWGQAGPPPGTDCPVVQPDPVEQGEP